jgi:hypothetical protein
MEVAGSLDCAAEPWLVVAIQLSAALHCGA